MPSLNHTILTSREWSALCRHLLIATLILPLPALSDGLRDAGYGDGSLIDSNGDYFYPRGNGTYLDTYGNLYIPGQDAAYQDDPDSLGDYDHAAGHDWDADSRTGAYRYPEMDDREGHDGYSGYTDPRTEVPTWESEWDRDRARTPAPVSYDPYNRTWSKDSVPRDTAPWDTHSGRIDTAEDAARGLDLDRDAMSDAYMDVGSGYLEFDSASTGYGIPTDAPALDATIGTRGGYPESPFGGPTEHLGGPSQSSFEYNPGLANYKRKYFGGDTDQIPKGLFTPDDTSRFEDAMRTRIHEEDIGPGQDFNPLLPFGQEERLLP